MIVSDNTKVNEKDFEHLLTDAQLELEELLQRDPNEFLRCDALKFEKNVFNAMNISAKGTIFDGSIQLISGHRFPDIVANKYYGVEVKTTKQDHWKTVGNSVLESTRVDGVERIYLMFGKLGKPIKFKFKKYQDCLYDVAVTHSPRYLIDMNLKPNDSIFAKMKIDYDRLRKLENPIAPVVEYYKKIIPDTNNIWWINDAEEKVVPMEIRMWSGLTVIEKKKYVAKAMVLFPEVLSRTSPTKYDRAAAWLIKEHGIVSSSLRDSFSAGGKVSLSINSTEYKNVPKVFEKITARIDLIADAINSLTPYEMNEYWQLSPLESENMLSLDDKLNEWGERLKEPVSCGLEDTNLDSKIFIKFIKTLIHAKNT